VRLSYYKNSAGALTIDTENNYYPFGLKHTGYNENLGNSAYNYKYNGKELQETGMYDYGARFYMPDIGRFGTIDPRSQYTHEAYSYVWNNPIFFNDPTGMTGEAFAHCPTCPNTAEFKTYIDDKYNVYVYDSTTNTASLKVTDIQEVTLTGKAKSNDSGPGGLAMMALMVSQFDSPAPGPADVVAAAMLIGAGVWWTVNQFTPPSTWYTTIADPGIGMRNLNSESDDTDVNGVKVPKEGKDFDDVWNDAKDGDATKGKSTQKEKDISDWEQDSKIKLQNEKEIDTKFGKGRTGLDSNGNRVNVRPGSKGANGGNPTIERIKNGRYQKIRYK
jgi:RHS repeat-associated protein